MRATSQRTIVSWGVRGKLLVYLPRRPASSKIARGRQRRMSREVFLFSLQRFFSIEKFGEQMILPMESNCIDTSRKRTEELRSERCRGPRPWFFPAARLSKPEKRPADSKAMSARFSIQRSIQSLMNRVVRTFWVKMKSVHAILLQAHSSKHAERDDFTWF